MESLIIFSTSSIKFLKLILLKARKKYLLKGKMFIQEYFPAYRKNLPQKIQEAHQAKETKN